MSSPPRQSPRNSRGSPIVQAEVLETIGETYEAVGERVKAVAFMEAAVKVRQQALGPNHPVSLAGQVKPRVHAPLRRSEPGVRSLACSKCSTGWIPSSPPRSGALAPAAPPSTPTPSGVEDARTGPWPPWTRSCRRPSGGADVRSMHLPTLSFGLAEQAHARLSRSARPCRASSGLKTIGGASLARTTGEPCSAPPARRRLPRRGPSSPRRPATARTRSRRPNGFSTKTTGCCSPCARSWAWHTRLKGASPPTCTRLHERRVVQTLRA